MTHTRENSRFLEVKIQPDATRSAVAGFRGGALHIKIAAPPEAGKANRELIDFLSRVLEVKKAAVRIVKGGTGRNKLISVEGMSPAEIVKRLI